MLAHVLTPVGWRISTFTRPRSHLAKKEGALLKVRAGTKNSLSCRASVRSPNGDAGSKGRETRASTATIQTSISGPNINAVEAPVGPHTKRPRLAVGTVLIVSASGDVDGSGESGGSAKSSKGDDE